MAGVFGNCGSQYSKAIKNFSVPTYRSAKKKEMDTGETKYAKAAARLVFAAGRGGAILLSHQRKEFVGERVKSADAYLLDIERMNGTDLHALELQKNDTLCVRLKTEQGALHLEIKAPDGTVVYRGNGKGISDFTIKVDQGGIFAVAVRARSAKGTVHILRKTRSPLTKRS